MRKSLLVLLAMGISACGTNNVTDQGGSAVNQTVSTVAGIAHGYLGAVRLPDQLATLRLSVTGNEGTGVVTFAGVSQRSGEVQLAGPVDPEGGHFLLTSSDGVVLGGTLPGHGDPHLILKQGAQGFRGPLNDADDGTPETGPVADANSMTIFGSASQLTAFNFTGLGYNGPNPPFGKVGAPNQLILGYMAGKTFPGNEIVLFCQNSGSSDPVMGLFVRQRPSDSLTTKTYPVDPGSPSGANLSLVSGSSGWGTLAQGTGNITIGTLTEQALEFDFDFKAVPPSGLIQPNSATGEFNTNGHISCNYL